MTTRTTLITGAAKRLGRQMAHHLAKQGWNIILHYNNSENEAKMLATEVMQAYNVQVHLWQNNFAHFKIEHLHNLPSFQLLVNNASIFINDSILSCTAESIQTHYQINTFTPVLLMQHLANNATGQANVINIVDSETRHLKPNFFSYLSSKQTLENLTKHAAALLAPKVRVNAIALGHVLRGERQSAKHFQQAQTNALLPHTPVTVPQLLNAIDFILATPCLTGQTLVLDGGRHLAHNSPSETIL